MKESTKDIIIAFFLISRCDICLQSVAKGGHMASQRIVISIVVRGCYLRNHVHL